MARVARVFTVFFSFISVICAAPPKPMPELCKEVTGIFPADQKIGSPLQERTRFETRRCTESDDQFVGFSAGSARPVFVEAVTSVQNTVHMGTAIVLMTLAGSCTPTYIAQVQNGRPRLLFNGAGRDLPAMQVKDDYLLITVWPKTYPVLGEWPKVRPHHFRLKIWPD